ncbi:MAG: hypothetical protein QM579_06350 [Desulfovibrio sp.]
MSKKAVCTYMQAAFLIVSKQTLIKKPSGNGELFRLAALHQISQ